MFQPKRMYCDHERKRLALLKFNLVLRIWILKWLMLVDNDPNEENGFIVLKMLQPLFFVQHYRRTI